MQYYTDYDTAVTTSGGSGSDGIQTLIDNLEEARYTTQTPEISWDLGAAGTDVFINHYWNYDVMKRISHCQHAEVNHHWLSIGVNPNRHLTLNVVGSSYTLAEPVEYAPDHYYMASTTLNQGTKRNCCTLSNVYACRQPDDFKLIHDHIAQRTERTDQTVRYFKGWLYYFSALTLQQMEESLPAPQYTPATALVGVNPATTIYHDNPAVQSPPQTRAWIQAMCVQNNCLYYAKPGTDNDTILVDALMNAQYPVYTYMMVDNAPGVANPIRAPITATVRFAHEPTTMHHTYTNDPATHARGVAPAGGGPSTVAWPAAPPAPAVLFQQMHAIAIANMETDSWLNGMLLATQYLVCNKLPGLGAAAGPEILPLLDHDVIGLGYSNPIYRCAQAFNFDETPPPLEPNARAILFSQYSQHITMYQYLAMMRSYARSTALAAFNWNGSALAQVPLRNR
jgi:hypothetical protein